MFKRSISRRAFTLGAAAAPLVLAGPARAFGGGWMQVRTPGFVLYARTSESNLRDFARDLEDFDGLLRQLHGAMERPEGHPLPIYLTPRRADLRRVRPDLPAGTGGFYTASVGEVFACLGLDANDDGGRDVLFHEYTHHFMAQHAPAAYPSWLVEGYAEYFMTTRFKPDVVELGVTSPRIAWLRGTVWESYQSILANRAIDGDRRDRAAFYAQAWILTHYMLSDPDRQARLGRYASVVALGGDPVAEMVTAAQMPLADLPKALQRYMGELPGRRIARPASTAGSWPVIRLSASADDLLLENQRLKMGVRSADRPALLALIRERAVRYPGDRLADLALARAENDFGDRPKAQAILKQRIEADPTDVEAIQMLGWSYMRAAAADPAHRAELLREAREWLGKGFKLDPDNALLLYDFGISRKGEAGYPSDNIVNVLVRAVQLSPQVPTFRVAAADALMRRDRFDDAANLLTPIFNNPHAGAGVERAKAQFERAKARRRPVDTPDDADADG
jgi:tetratricopeptide (TPR) repeat protein